MAEMQPGLLQPRAPFTISYKRGCKALISMVTSSFQHTNTPTLGSLILSHSDFPVFSHSPELRTSVMHGKWHPPNVTDKLFCQEEPDESKSVGVEAALASRHQVCVIQRTGRDCSSASGRASWKRPRTCSVGRVFSSWNL